MYTCKTHDLRAVSGLKPNLGLSCTFLSYLEKDWFNRVYRDHHGVAQFR